MQKTQRIPSGAIALVNLEKRYKYMQSLFGLGMH